MAKFYNVPLGDVLCLTGFVLTSPCSTLMVGDKYARLTFIHGDTDPPSVHPPSHGYMDNNNSGLNLTRTEIYRHDEETALPQIAHGIREAFAPGRIPILNNTAHQNHVVQQLKFITSTGFLSTTITRWHNRYSIYQLHGLHTDDNARGCVDGRTPREGRPVASKRAHSSVDI